VAAGAALAPAAEPEEGSYWALFADGKEVTGKSIRDWHYRERRASLSGRRLFDPPNPVLVLCHTHRRPGGAGPRVFLANGDVLPGRVTGFLPADPADNQPDRLAVALAPPLAAGREERRDSKGQIVGNVVSIRPESVTGVVFGDGPARPHRGGVVFLADGTAQSVTSIRWTPRGLKALAADAIVTATFQELSEVHLPKVDTMAALRADAMLPSPTPDNRIGRMETTEGAVLTYRTKMRESRSTRRRGRQDYFHALQPAWSLTPIAVPEGSVAVRTYRKPTEVPLSLLPAETLVEKSFTGFLWPWRRNRNVRGDLLRCGSLFCGLGVGTHSYSEVAFSLPPGARAFSCTVGLDRAVGAGGCTRCAIHQDAPGGRRLWRSNLLVGSGPPVRVGPLSVDKARRLVLVTEFAHPQRPRGADPGDIRDEVNWMMPLVTVDPASLALDEAGVRRCLPILEGWSVRPAELAAMKLSMAAAGRGPWQPAMDLDASGGLTLTRKIKVSPANGFLEVAAARGHNDSGHVIEVRVNGEPLKGFYDDGKPVYTRSRGPGDETAQRWLLAPGLGKTVTIEVKATRDKDRRDGKYLLWRSLSLHPLIRGLGRDGRPRRPDVYLHEAELKEAIWFPQDKGKRPEKTDAPQPATVQVYGVDVPHSLHVTQGMRLTYVLRPEYRRFAAVVHSDSPWHRGPMIVRADEKEIWRSDEAFHKQRWPIQVVVDIPRGAKTLSLVPEHNMTDAVWGQAGFLRR